MLSICFLFLLKIKDQEVRTRKKRRRTAQRVASVLWYNTAHTADNMALARDSTNSTLQQFSLSNAFSVVTHNVLRHDMASGDRSSG